MSRPLTITKTVDLDIGASSQNILSGLSDATLDEDSLILVYMNREVVEITAQITVGSVQAMGFGASRLEATVGVGPAVPTDRVCLTAGKKGEIISINGANGNAAVKELRVIVFIIPLVDIRNYPTILSNA